MKHMVARQNTTFRIKEVERLTKEALDAITADDWIKCNRHVIGIEEKMRHLDGIVDVEPVVIPLTDSDDDSMSNLSSYH